MENYKFEIRVKTVSKNKLNTNQKESFENLSKIIEKLVKLEDFKDRIGAELVVTEKLPILHVSAFNPKVLSSFILSLMVKVSGTSINCGFAKDHEEEILTPLFTNRIEIR